MHAPLNDEYQDAASMGSLASARRCWLDLRAAQALIQPQQFFFAFDCPSPLMALGLVGFLRYAPYAGFVDARYSTGVRQVVGTTRARACSLSSLEHLFMGLRQAATRYDSRLVTLALLPVPATHA